MALLDIKFSQTVFVLDLDDTLYREVDYQASGFREVVKYIERTYYTSVTSIFEQLQKQNEKDILGGLCRAIGLPDTVKQSLLWIYRLHEPEIFLSTDLQEAIVRLEQESRGVVVLTDGRSVTQRLKLKALGLSHLPVYISEEFGDEKPSPLRFEAIMQNIPANRYIYVADNPAKDFVAPNQLGWMTVGIKGDIRNIHSQKVLVLNETYQPHIWINLLTDLFD